MGRRTALLTGLQMAGLLAVLLGRVGTAGAASFPRLIWPPPGTVLTPAYDVAPEPGVQVGLVVTAPASTRVWVNGAATPALAEGDWPVAGRLDTLGLIVRGKETGPWQVTGPLGQFGLDPRSESLFLARITATGPVVEVELIGRGNRKVDLGNAVLYYRPEPRRTYSVTLDDGGDLLADISRDSVRYASPFDHPVLALVRRLHEEYGTCFSFFLFHEGMTRPGSDLDQVPERLRSELAASSGWLRWGFHARAYDPPEPYRNAPYDQAAADLAAVQVVVTRFAGAASWDPCLRAHFWSGSRASCRAWRDAGIVALYSAAAGYRSYYLTSAERDLLTCTDFWRDDEEDLLFVQSDLWLERAFTPAPAGTAAFRNEVAAVLDSVFQVPCGIQDIQVYSHEDFLTEDDHWNIGERLVEVAAELQRRGIAPALDGDDPFIQGLPPVPPGPVRCTVDGERVSLSWDHPRPQGLRYRVFRKTLTEQLDPWSLAGETDQLWFSEPGYRDSSYYRVVAVDPHGRVSGGSAPVWAAPSWSSLVQPDTAVAPGTAGEGTGIPDGPCLALVYPNPFNHGVTVPYRTTAPGRARLQVLDLAGRLVVSLVDEVQAPGWHCQAWDGADAEGRLLASGVYLVTLQAEGVCRVRRVVVLR